MQKSRSDPELPELMTSIDLPFTKRTLANGLDVIVHEDHHVPIVAVNIWYHVGPRNEPPGRSGFRACHAASGWPAMRTA